MKRPRPLDRSRLKSFPRAGERRLFAVADSGRLPDPEGSFRDFADSIPRTLAGRTLREVATAIADAHAGGRPVLAMVGAHVVKAGCNPILVGLLERGLITALAFNGATAIHDFELACFGDTSEDVSEGLASGRFGMWEETGAWMNRATREAHLSGDGMGLGLGRHLLERKAPHLGHSLLASSVRLGVPVTVHVALGTDVIHQHPEADGAAIGATSLLDLDLLAGILSDFEGGVVLNLGSAVVLPEVFLKALTMARNVGGRTDGMTLVNCDLSPQYRTRMNLLERPARECNGRALQILGPHELILPLLSALILQKVEIPVGFPAGGKPQNSM